MASQKHLILSLLLLSAFNLDSSQIISGNSASTEKTTSFSIGPHAFDRFGGMLMIPTMYIGAKSAVANNAYAVARANPSTNQLEPLAPEKINLNGIAAQSNPLFGAQINFLKLNNDLPVAIKDGSLAVYKYVSSHDDLMLISSDSVHDTTGADTSEILALEVANGGKSQTFVACNATTPGSVFGETGSGIALYEYVLVNKNSSLVFQNNQKACALDNESDSIKIQDSVTLANAVDLHWVGELGCLYVGVQAQAGGSAGDGARSIVVGKIQPVDGQTYDQIVFEKFAPDSLFTGNNQIIGTATAGATVSALKIKSLSTSTKLNYLIVVGGNGAANTVGNQVYALPLVSGQNSNIGQLANINQTPTNTYAGNLNVFVGRTLDEPATSANDAPTNNSPAAKVGGGVLPINPNESISDIFIGNDSVYVSIGTSSASNATGMFYSQAIFDQNGLIQNWTPWQRAGGYTGGIFGMGIDLIHGFYWQLIGGGANTVHAVKYTFWGSTKDGLLGGTTTNAGVGLVSNLSGLFPNSGGGIFNLTNVSKLDPALLNEMTLLLATGASRVAMINPSAAVNGDFSSGLVQSSNDEFPTASSSSTIAYISGTNLNTLGPITTCQIATNASGMSWFAVGGAGGVAILRKSDGSGWNSPLTSLGDLNSSFKFEIFGNYSFVNALASDDKYLYILTPTSLDRVLLTSSNLASSTPLVETIAEVGSVAGTVEADCWNDFLVTENLGLLVGSAGLFRTSNGTNLQDADVSWTNQTVPDQRSAPCSKLIAISPTGLNTGLANGGNLYLVSSYRGLQQTQVNRFYVKSGGTITDSTIQPLPDIYIEGVNSSFINFESFRDLFFTDGTLLIESISKDTNKKSYAHIMPPGISSGMTAIMYKKFYNINLGQVNEIQLISNVTHDANAGAILVAGDFGLQVNE